MADPNRKHTKAIMLRTTPAVYEALQSLAAADGRTAGALLRKIVNEWLSDKMSVAK